MTPITNILLITSGYLIGVAVQKGSMPEAVGALFSVVAWLGCGLIQAFRRKLQQLYIDITGDDE